MPHTSPLQPAKHLLNTRPEGSCTQRAMVHMQHYWVFFSSTLTPSGGFEGISFPFNLLCDLGDKWVRCVGTISQQTVTFKDVHLWFIYDADPGEPHRPGSLMPSITFPQRTPWDKTVNLGCKVGMHTGGKGFFPWPGLLQDNLAATGAGLGTWVSTCHGLRVMQHLPSPTRSLYYPQGVHAGDTL